MVSLQVFTSLSFFQRATVTSEEEEDFMVRPPACCLNLLTFVRVCSHQIINLLLFEEILVTDRLLTRIASLCSFPFFFK